MGLKRLDSKYIHVVKGKIVAFAKANNPKNSPIK